MTEEWNVETSLDEDGDELLTGETARESLASLGLSLEESQKVPDYDETIKVFNEGDIVTGTVVKVDKDEVLLDIGYKSEGVIPARELSIRYDVKTSDIVTPGEELEALVLQKEDKEGRLILSKKRAQYEKAWEKIENIKRDDEVAEGEVIEVVKGGLILDIGLRGFLPASLVEMRRVKDLSQYVGQKLEAKVIELDKNRNNVVLSRRAYLEKQKSNERQEFLEQLEPNTKRKGTVSSIVNFGAFVDLGSVDGLIHISELSWSHVDHPSELLAVGDEVEVEILDVDLERERVSLSLKKAKEDPWKTLSKEHPAGSTVHGKVTKLVPFGAFVEIAPGVEGLVHISELAWEHIEFPEEILSVGEEIDAKIIDIDLNRRRISLSLKQLTGPGEVDYQESPDGVPAEPELVESEELESGAGRPPVEEIALEAAEIAAEVSGITEETEPMEPEVVEGEEATELEVSQQAEAAVEEVVPEEPPAQESTVETLSEQAEEGSPEEESEMVEPSSDESAGAEASGEALNDPPDESEEGSLESILADMKKKGQQE
jgi:small subunit ribosomal protein S1